MWAKARIVNELPVSNAVLSRVESAFVEGLDSGFASLRRLDTQTVGRILLGVPSRYPRARAALPVMADEQVQRGWTGTSGGALLTQSTVFIDAVVSRFKKYGSVPLVDATVLDYGCGWGRLIRLMYAHASPENIYGCDPWDRSIELCREARLRANLAVSDYVPSSLPFTTPFHLIYAFSVFTHLSQRTADAVMSTLRKHVAPDGLLVITIRPESYWPHDPSAADRAGELQRIHRDEGFAFAPHPREPIEGDITYGDTSMSMEYVAKRWPDWQILESEIHPYDPHQQVVYLKPA